MCLQDNPFFGSRRAAECLPVGPIPRIPSGMMQLPAGLRVSMVVTRHSQMVLACFNGQ